MRRVLVLGDEFRSRNFLRISLERNGYDVHAVSANNEGLNFIRSIRPDIILLELKPPDPNGLGLLSDIRARTSIPVLVLSVAGFANDVAALLDAGADDYVTIPFNLEELLARMNVVLRRTPPSFHESSIACGDLEMDLDARSVSVDGREVVLTPTEYAILAYLARNRGEGVSMAKLLKELWDPLAAGERGSLRDHITSLRRKIERDSTRPEYLITEPELGYVLSCSPMREWSR
jgi:two-component system KDP operon response regulator KdpE